MKVFKFLKRLHPNKPSKWIKEKYFPPYYDGQHYGNWVLTHPKSGKILKHMNWTLIRRFIMIKHDYTPYNKNLNDYFVNRNTNFYLRY